jgi:exodeoxyribonuclease VIII
MHGRPDIIGADYVADLKTTQSLSPGLFSSTAWRLGYFFQAGIYLEAANELFGMRERSFYWIAVESNPPHDVAVFEADVESVNRGWEEYRSCVSLLAECEATGQWPGQFPERVKLSAPAWAGASEDDVDFEGVEGSEE